VAALGILDPVVGGAAEEELFIRKSITEWQTESRERKRAWRGKRGKEGEA
jgi:hypothetical protein